MLAEGVNVTCDWQQQHPLAVARSLVEEERYEKKKKTASSYEGHLYEVKMVCLLFLRLTNDKNISEFHLMSNVKDLYPWDDIVLNYSTVSDPKMKTVFIQVKHRTTDPLLTHMFKKGYQYDLRPFFEKFLQICVLWEDKPIIFKGDFECCQFLIYTSAEEGLQFGKRSRQDSRGDIDHLFNTVPEAGMNRSANSFNFNEHSDKDIFVYIRKEAQSPLKVKEFFNAVRVFSGQAFESELDGLIKKELKKYCLMTSAEIDLIYPFCEEAFLQWWGYSDIILKKGANILNQAFHKFKINTSSLEQEKEYCFNLQFKTAHFFNFDILNTAVYHIQVNSNSSIKMTCTKLINSLQKVEGGYIFMSVGSLVRNSESVLAAWVSGNKRKLVIVGRSNGEHSELHDVLLACLQKYSTKEVILVSEADDKLAEHLRQSLIGRWTAVYDFFCLDQLETMSAETIMDREVLFQGWPVTLGELLEGSCDSLSGVLNDDFVHAILEFGVLSVGSHLKDDIPYYITRILERYDTVDKSILRANDSNNVVIVDDKVIGRDNEDSGGILEQVTKTSPYSAKDEHKFHTFADGSLRWTETKGNIDFIRKYITKEVVSPATVNTIFDLDGRVILIVAESGMGKSTVVDHLASKTKQHHPLVWVIRVDLRSHLELLEEFPDDAEEFLASAVGSTWTPSERSLFSFSIRKRGNCVVLLDGFDEIAPEYITQGLSLLTSLLQTEAKKIVVTSRYEMKHILESHLSTLTFTLRKFDELDQKHFFVKFWLKDKMTLTWEQEELIKYLVKLIANSLHDSNKEFMGVPLQIMILAEYFENFFFSNKSLGELPEKLNILPIFIKVIIRKFNIYIKKKFPGIRNIGSERKRLLESLFKQHMNASLVLLLGKKVEKLRSEQDILKENYNFLKEIKNYDNKTGIIVGVFNGIPIFLHKTFAEYFVAEWFHQNYEDNREFLSQTLFAAEFTVIRRLFDLLLTDEHIVFTVALNNEKDIALTNECAIFTAVLNNEMNIVCALLKSGTDIKSTDKGGRSVLHLAACLNIDFYSTNTAVRHVNQSVQSMIQLLLEHWTEDLNVKDTVFQWNPLEYAVNTKAWDAVELLLEFGSKLFQTITNESVLVDLYGWGRDKSTLIHAAAAHGHVNVVRLLVLSLWDNVWACNAHHHTPLHVSCAWGHINVVRALVGAVENRTDLASAHGSTRGSLHGRDSSVVIGPDFAGCSNDDESQSQEILQPYKSNSLYLSKNFFNSSARESVSVSGYINAVGHKQRSALHIACEEGDKELVSLLISKGGDVWAEDETGKTALQVACSAGNEPAVHALLESFTEGQGDDKVKYLNTVDHHEVSALHLVSKYGHSNIVGLLIFHGADVGISDCSYSTPLHVACAFGKLDVARALVESIGENKKAQYINRVNYKMNKYGWYEIEGVSALQLASRRGFCELVEYLLRNGGNAWAEGRCDGTLLHDACEWGDINMARGLITCIDDDDIETYIETKDDFYTTAKDIALDISEHHSEEQGLRLAEYLDSVLKRVQGSSEDE